jgi:hypothetical protein
MLRSAEGKARSIFIVCLGLLKYLLGYTGRNPEVVLEFLSLTPTPLSLWTVEIVQGMSF